MIDLASFNYSGPSSETTLSGVFRTVNESAQSLLNTWGVAQNIKLSAEKLKTDAKIAGAQLAVDRATAEAGADLAKAKAAAASQLAIEQVRANSAAAIAGQAAGYRTGFSTVEILSGLAAALTIYGFFAGRKGAA